MNHLAGLADATSVYADLLVEIGEFLEGASTVLPDNEHFPDAVAATPEGVRVLFERILGYTAVSSKTKLALHFTAPAEEAGGKSCGSGACGPGLEEAAPWQLAPLEEDETGTWNLFVPVQAVGHPVRLMSQLSRLAGDLLLAQSGAVASADPFERAVRAEVAAVACGLGPLLLSASHLTVKGCGGLRVHEGTALPTVVLAGLVVLFAAHREEPSAVRAVSRLMQPTAQEALAEARVFFSKRPTFLQQLRDTPEAISFHCDFGPEEGLFKRLFASKERQPLALRV